MTLNPSEVILDNIKALSPKARKRLQPFLPLLVELIDPPPKTLEKCRHESLTSPRGH